MLTDEELTARLSAAFHENVPELTYAGPVPQVRRSHTGFVATSVLAAAAALVLTPAALQRGEDAPSRPAPSAEPGAHASSSAGRHVYTLDLGGVRLSFASNAGDPGDIYFVFGPDTTLPPDAERLDLGLGYGVWFVDDPASGQPQMYIGHRACPDTEEGCNGQPPQLELYGILAPGWTRDQLIHLVEHPLYTQTHLRDGKRVLTPPRVGGGS